MIGPVVQVTDVALSDTQEKQIYGQGAQQRKPEIQPLAKRTKGKGEVHGIGVNRQDLLPKLLNFFFKRLLGSIVFLLDLGIQAATDLSSGLPGKADESCAGVTRL